MADGSNAAEKKAPLLTGWMIVVIVGIIAVAVVGITALFVHGSTSKSASTTTKAPGVQTTVTTTTVAPTTTVPVPTITPASLTNFVGTWSMHDGGLVIAASGAGTITMPGLMYGGCVQTAQIKVSPATTTTALATIASIEASSCAGVPTSFNPSGGGGTNVYLDVGSTFTITIAPPGVQTSWGINYCDQAHAVQQVCGA